MKDRLVLGLQPARELLRVRPEEVVEVLVDDKGGPKVEGLERLAASRGVSLRRTSTRELDRIAKGGRHQGVIATAAELPVLDKDDLLEAVDAWPTDAPSPVVLALDGVMDPQNFGASVRSAVALGADFVIWPEHSSAPLSPAMFRASAGAVEHARLTRVHALPEVLRELRARAFEVVVLDPRGTMELSEVDLTLPCVLVIGAEDKGSRGPVKRESTRQARLPITDRIDSLNASVAAAVALYEARRQRVSPTKT